ncbi:MAG: iron-containing alcohol dehydrogenase [Planctomycetes bacterium]|nr:iron-containing alcohol dehydrogenase [Planctomycetota bacterium]
MSGTPFNAKYDYLSPQRVVFGWGRRCELGALARPFGRRAFLVVGSRALEGSGAIAELEGHLRKEGIEPVRAASAAREPEVGDVDRLAAFLRERGAGAGDLVIAAGGGSAIDLAKAGCAMATNRKGATVRDYLEGVGAGLKVEEDPLPLLAVPTTAGTGSEATKNAVISSYDPPFKVSLRSDRMVPRVVLVDPELHVSVPRATTAHTGMDAITQLIESYISARAAPIPQALAIHGLALAATAIARAVKDGADREARERMAHAALLSGMALANSGLGMAHGVAAALGIHAKVAHGLACAVMLPVALRVNREVREAEIARIAEVLCGRSFPAAAAAAQAAVERVEELCAEVGIPRRLSEIGVRREALPAIVKSSYGNSMAANPRKVPEGELTGLLEAML